MNTEKTRLMRILAVLLATFALVAGACTDDKSSDGDSSSDDSEQDSGSGEDSGTDSGDVEEDSGSEEGEGSGSGGDFIEVVAEATEDVQNAGDPCDLYSAVAVLATVGNPETVEETRAAVDFYVVLVNKMADTSSDPANAEALRTGAEQFEAYAKSVDYDPEQMDLAGMGPQFEGSEQLNVAMNEYGNTEFEECDLLEGDITSPDTGEAG
ncbi:MAG: hypothetical protein KDB31_14785 [Microthrixaceae bacterium]|nr:hypothetical protein [Microthrixaceae bacterium]